MSDFKETLSCAVENAKKQRVSLTSSTGLPMNFPLFHQVMVALGLEPTLRHSTIAGLEIENGSTGSTMDTFSGSTATKMFRIKFPSKTSRLNFSQG